MTKRVPIRFEEFSFGSIRIDDTTDGHGVVIDRRHIHKWNEKPSKKFRDTFGLTPLSIEEDIPWKCQRLVIGTGTGALPVMDEVKREAHRRKIKLDILPIVAEGAGRQRWRKPRETIVLVRLGVYPWVA